MTRRSQHKLHIAIIVLLALGVFGSSAWLVLYDTTSGRYIGSSAPAAPLDPPGPSPRDLHSDVERIRKTVQSDGFLGSNLARYQLRAGRFPDKLRGLMERPQDLDPAVRWDGPYVGDPEVLDDAWDQPYQYVYPGVHNADSYDLWSVGPDGVSGTADDIGNW